MLGVDVALLSFFFRINVQSIWLILFALHPPVINTKRNNLMYFCFAKLYSSTEKVNTILFFDQLETMMGFYISYFTWCANSNANPPQPYWTIALGPSSIFLSQYETSDSSFKS